MELRIKIKKPLLLVVLALMLSLGFKPYDDLFEFSKNMEIFNSAYKAVGKNYVDEVNPGELMRKGLDAMFESLDPYTNFFSESQAEEALIERNREYGGVGCRTIMKNKLPLVTDVFEGYAFAKADVRPGDYILSVEGQSLEGKSQADLSALMRGAPNTKFNIVIKRGSTELPKEITRQQVRTKNVPYFGMINSAVGYIKLESFGENCSSEVTDAFLKLKAKGMTKVILDLRDNGGGLLNEAVNIIGLFTGPGKVVVTMRGKNAENNRDWKTSNPTFDTEIPVVVLVNGQSASASEVVSGGLQDLDRAVIIGRNSFGKGLVQNYINLPYRTQMKVTIAKYYCPSGRCVQLRDYSKRNTDGSAQEIPVDKRKLFTTTKGRKVYDGGGVQPDIKVDEFGGQSLFKTMIDELYFFDFANEYRTKNDSISNANEFKLSNLEIENFKNWSSNKLFLNVKNKLVEDMGKATGDKDYAKEFYNSSETETSLKNLITSKMKNMDKLIKYRLEHEILKRYFLETAMYKHGFDADPDLLMAIETLEDNSKYTKLLTP